MKYCVVATANVMDDSWTEAYTREVTKLVEQFGGRYIIRSSNVEVLEGKDRPEVLVVMEFPSKEAFTRFYQSEEYQPYLEARKKGAKGNFFLVPMIDETSES